MSLRGVEIFLLLALFPVLRTGEPDWGRDNFREDHDVMSASERFVDPKLTLNFDSPVDARLQGWLEEVDGRLREELGMETEDAAVGLLDLRTGRLAMIHPDRIEYAA